MCKNETPANRKCFAVCFELWNLIRSTSVAAQVNCSWLLPKLRFSYALRCKYEFYGIIRYSFTKNLGLWANVESNISKKYCINRNPSNMLYYYVVSVCIVSLRWRSNIHYLLIYTIYSVFMCPLTLALSHSNTHVLCISMFLRIRFVNHHKAEARRDLWIWNPHFILNCPKSWCTY